MQFACRASAGFLLVYAWQGPVREHEHVVVMEAAGTVSGQRSSGALFTCECRYYSPQLGEEGGHEEIDDDEDDDDYPMHPMDMVHMHEDEDEEEDEDESDDEDDSDEDEDFELAKPPGRSPSVIIEDITDQEKV